ncbi:MAG: hypothetical protein WCE79_16500 [Xanthobacteraceae bacterium]|jgi:hypothetical protein
MKNHSLIDADSNTHVKIAAVALVASVVFMVVVSVSGVARWESVAVHGPIVKATTSTTIAGGGLSTVR